MKLGDVLIPVISYFVVMSIFEWIFGKFFWSFDSLLYLIAKEKFFSAIILLVIIYFLSWAMASGLIEENSDNGRASVVLIGIVLLLMAGEDIYNISQIEDFDDAFGTFVEIIVKGSYTEIL